MYCPTCKAEYRPGFTECADCGVDLVYELPEEQPLSREEDLAGDLVPVYSTFNLGIATVAMALLEGEGIVHHVQGEPHKGSGYYVSPTIIFVARAEAEKVREMLRDHGIE